MTGPAAGTVDGPLLPLDVEEWLSWLATEKGRGLGDAILTALIELIRSDAPPGAWVNLLADPPGRRLYARHGFTETAPHSIGMALTID